MSLFTLIKHPISNDHNQIIREWPNLPLPIQIRFEEEKGKIWDTKGSNYSINIDEQVSILRKIMLEYEEPL